MRRTQRQKELAMIKKVPFPVDNVNDEFWRHEKGGSFKTAVVTGKNNDIHGKVKYGATMPIEDMRLTEVDRRIYYALAAFWKSGIKAVKINRIYEIAGYKCNSSETQNNSIIAAMGRMIMTKLQIDNEPEIKAGMKYQPFKYNGPLLPAELRRAENEIILQEEPPLVRFAESRNQISGIPVEVFRTEDRIGENLCGIEHYLIKRIIMTKRYGAKILLKTLYENTGAKDSKSNQKRVMKYAERFLNYYTEIGFIRGYEIKDTKDGYILMTPAEGHEPKPAEPIKPAETKQSAPDLEKKSPNKEQKAEIPESGGVVWLEPIGERIHIDPRNAAYINAMRRQFGQSPEMTINLALQEKLRRGIEEFKHIADI